MVGKITLLEVAKLISEYQQNLQKHVNICCCSFNNILIKGKNFARRNLDPIVNFDLMINIDLFWPNNFGIAHISARNLVCGRFMNYEKGRKNLTLLTFGCPSCSLYHL